ncbi:MAG: 16S rRNA (guanine(527)-N(7))-methyltransferase RsmG [Rhodobacteraceae bacterium]|nr:16S rRNA (guanine(527)-N(7))-methyltransferase RsmG [Paracoccaceae bacterium]
MAKESFLAARNVSRETLDRLTAYESLLKKWNPAINLVARSTLGAFWQRHALDSAQVFDIAPKSGTEWADLGSGGGFPGLVVAIIAADERPDLRVTLVESDKRKAAFLMTVIRETGVKARVLAERAEAVAPLEADILSARALAPLDQLLGYAVKHLKTNGIAIFPKGGNYADEVKLALENWRFTLHKDESRTEPGAVILTIGGISRV